MGLFEGLGRIVTTVVIDTPVNIFKNVEGTLTEGENPFSNMGYDLAKTINNLADAFDE